MNCLERQALVYALKQIYDENCLKVVIQEYVHSLNRKHMVSNDMVDIEIDRLLEDIRR